MNSWFSKLIFIFASIFGSVAFYAFAGCCHTCSVPTYLNPHGYRCACDWCEGGFTFGVDFIYWKPCIDDLNYAVHFDPPIIPLPGVENSIYHHTNPSWQPGVRGFVVFDHVCGVDLVGTYTWITTRNRSAINAAPPFTVYSTQFTPLLTDSSFFSLTSKYRLEYQNFELLINTVCCRGYHMLKPFFGVTGVFLDQKIETSGIETLGALDELTWVSSCWGVGLIAGAEYRCAFAKEYGIFFLGSGAVVTGISDAKRTERRAIGTISEVAIQYRDDNQCHFLNGYHMATGLFYSDVWCYFNFTLRVGYEWVKWHNITNLRRFSSNAVSQIGTSSSSLTSTLGFHGLFAGFALHF